MNKKSNWLSEIDPDILSADGFESAILGYSERAGGQPAIAVYDTQKCLEVLIERDGMTEDEAYEYFYFNVVGAWVGEYTPAFITLYGED